MFKILISPLLKILISQRLIRLQHMVDPIHGLLVPAELDKSRPLDIQNILFDDQCPGTNGPAGDHVSDNTAHLIFVFSNEASFLHVPQLRLDAGGNTASRGLDHSRIALRIILWPGI